MATSSAKISQEVLEVNETDKRNARLSQIVLEANQQLVHNARLSQIVLEVVLAPNWRVYEA